MLHSHNMQQNLSETRETGFDAEVIGGAGGEHVGPVEIYADEAMIIDTATRECLPTDVVEDALSGIPLHEKASIIKLQSNPDTYYGHFCLIQAFGDVRASCNGDSCSVCLM